MVVTGDSCDKGRGRAKGARRYSVTDFLLCSRSFRQAGGAVLVTRLAKSKQHPMKIVFAANKVCALLSCSHAYVHKCTVVRSLGPPSAAFDKWLHCSAFTYVACGGCIP